MRSGGTRGHILHVNWYASDCKSSLSVHNFNHIMARADAGTRTPHLFSALIACALTAAILWAGRVLAVHLEHSTLPAIASEVFPLKNQGLAFQRAAVRAPDVLPIYGSSELIHPIPDRSSAFFRTAPTGFQVS